MNFVYINYEKDFINEIKKRKPNNKTILVFSDYFFKNSYMKNREKNILALEPVYFTLEEFQKKIFKTEKMILTEAKRPLTLFRVFDKELKEKFKMQNYYDTIDFADLFFKYYKELYSVMGKKPSGLQEWQEEYIERFEILKERYDKYLKENDFIPSDWIENIENYNEEYIKKFERIIFIDIPYFTPLMREAIKRISNICETQIMIQILKEDYNEELLKIEKVSLIKNREDIDIKIYENSDEMSEILNMICLGKMRGHKRKDIFSPVPERNNYHKVFPKYFVSQELKVLDDTKLYKFMKIQNELLLSLEPRKKYGVPSFELRKAVNDEIFREIYKIDGKTLSIFKKIFDKEYKYIDEKVFDYEKTQDEDFEISQNEIFNKIYEDLKKISKFLSVTEFVDYIREIGFEKFREENYTNIIEKFYQAVDNIKSSERLCGEDGFKNLFETSTGANLYTLLIKYMEGIEINEVERDGESVLGVIKNISEARLNNETTKMNETYFIDIDNKSLPGNLKDNLNFTEEQRAESGFMTFEDKKLISKYRFIQGIFNSKKSVILVKKNLNEEIERSVFLDEIMMKYNIKVEKENPLSKEEIFKILKKNISEEKEIVEKNISEEYFKLEKDILDFEDKKMTLGAYDILELEGCKYRHFLKNNGKISPEKEEVYGVSSALLGTVVHKIFEIISQKIYINIIKKNDFTLDEKFVDNIIEETFEENQMKIPVYVDLYLKEILFPKIKENIFKFYKEMEKEVKGKKVNMFWGEKGRIEKFLSDEIDVFIKGRVDLIAQTDEGDKYIVDYKTGGADPKQLDIYSILLYKDENVACKIIYNALQGDYKKQDKISITKDELTQMFKDFISSKEYLRAEKKKACAYCEYENICKREVI
ncbi:PD-(D/E)XK nuclease family protein [Fusobacterium sp.]|uniref:PD-(D/E)XK nuclease family protein n=1 Tax=Fusobacterium sp. TaxID=68766 RepID=UPI0026275441|nr:PD-(D/E)XK nuclease family protein [Fusobacterium sp.]